MSPNCPEVVLTPGEVDEATDVAIHRHESSESMGYKAGHGFRGSYEDRLELHIQGACGEKALSKYLGVIWDKPIDTYKRGFDVGHYQVRTATESRFSLIVRNNDRDEDIFVLVVGRRPRYNIVGWITGKEAKDKRWLKCPGGREPAFFVPQHALKSIETLPRFEITS